MSEKAPRPDALFAYGSLRVPEVMHAVTGRFFSSLPATLADHVVLRIADVVYPGLVSRPGVIAHGRLYLGLDTQTLHVLDVFEDAAYERVALPVLLDNGESRRAFVYRIRDSHRSVLRDEPWDAAAFEREHASAFAQRCRGFHRTVS